MKIIRIGGASPHLPQMNEDGRILRPEQATIDAKDAYAKAKEAIVKEDCRFVGTDEAYPILKAFSELNSNAGIIVVNANGSSVRKLIEDGIVKKENVILLGVRDWDSPSFYFFKENKMKFFSAKEISFEGLSEVCDAVMTASNRFPALFLDINLNVLEEGSIGKIEKCTPGGLRTREILYIIQRLKMLRNLKCADVMGADGKDEISGKILSELL